MFHDTHIHLEMLLDKLKMSDFRQNLEILENFLWQKNLEKDLIKNSESNSKSNLQFLSQNQALANILQINSNSHLQISKNTNQQFLKQNSEENLGNLSQYFDKINQIKITKEQQNKIEELFQNHQFAIHSTVNFANFGLVYQLFESFDKIKFLFGSHPEIVNANFDLEKYLTNQQTFLNIWTQKWTQTQNIQTQNQPNFDKNNYQDNLKNNQKLKNLNSTKNWTNNLTKNSTANFINNTNYNTNYDSKNSNSHISNSNWSKKVVGIGEIGLDYFYTKDQNLIKIQQKLFESQIELSLNWQSIFAKNKFELNQKITNLEKVENLENLEMQNIEIEQNSPKFDAEISSDLQNNLQNNLNSSKNLSIVIHCREAFADLISILKSFPKVHGNFLVHCWTGNVDELRQILDIGGIVAFGGILTYKNAEILRIAARFCPLESLVLETDLPFLSPQSRRKEVCLPNFIDETCEILSQIKNIQKALIWQKSLQNTKKLFRF